MGRHRLMARFAALAALCAACAAAPVLVAPSELLTTASPVSLSYSGFNGETASITLSSRSAPGTVIASATAAGGSSGTVPFSLPANVQAGVYLLNVSFSTGYRQSGDVTIVAPSSLLVRAEKPQMLWALRPSSTRVSLSVAPGCRAGYRVRQAPLQAWRGGQHPSDCELAQLLFCSTLMSRSMHRAEIDAALRVSDACHAHLLIMPQAFDANFRPLGGTVRLATLRSRKCTSRFICARRISAPPTCLTPKAMSFRAGVCRRPGSLGVRRRPEHVYPDEPGRRRVFFPALQLTPAGDVDGARAGTSPRQLQR